ncbi:hypothetical protein [Aquibacillus salsiterrae]|uniref:Uncharacterized protein n=1 Tax=Aquibacillus salsiterrae TaxID=2950439 RepID=A0A9X3WAG4_9BACI|nr:hypothetical protein [Aquibacillus salsiterrae]MDC3415520.1 hypothetical protein [Aquibacillus salsiterrae]
MKLILGISSFVLGLSLVFKKRYQVLNTLLAVRVIRKLLVAVTMKLPNVRQKILPSILGRSAS